MNEIAQVDNLRILIRSPRPTDQSYVAATWTQSIQAADRKLGKSDANQVVDRMLDDPSVRLMIASESTNTNTIIGWLAYTPQSKLRIIHYVYTREKMRRRGVASALYRKVWPRDIGKLVFTMRGPDASALLKRWPYAVAMPFEEFLTP